MHVFGVFLNIKLLTWVYIYTGLCCSAQFQLKLKVGFSVELCKNAFEK